MIDRIRNMFSSESYSPVTLFEVKNVISGEGRIDLPEEKRVREKSVEKKVVKKTSKKGRSVLDVMRDFNGEVNSTDVLAKCLEEGVCSRATFFRKMNKLVKEGKLTKRKEGKEVFYDIA